MPSGYRGYQYDIAGEWRIRVLQSRADFFHIVRKHIPALAQWSEEDTHHVGFKLRSILGDERAVAAGLPDVGAAVVSLRAAVIRGLESAVVPEPGHRALRDAMVADVAAAGVTAIDPWEPIFSYAAHQAAMLFGDRWPGVRFEIAGATGPYYREDIKLYANASTDMRLGKPADCPVVRVGIWDQKFNPETYATLFALLVHELVCHVASPRVQSEDPNKSFFAEGFADWAAEQYFERWLSSMEATLRPAARTFGRKLVALGYDKEGGNPHWGYRQAGRSAAELVVDLLRDAKIASKLAIDRVMILANELTVLDVDLIEKDLWVSNLGDVGSVMRGRLLRWGKKKGSVHELLLPVNDES